MGAYKWQRVTRGPLRRAFHLFGQLGWVYQEREANAPSKETRMTRHKCPCIRQVFKHDETRSFGQPWVDQEYNCFLTPPGGMV